MGVVFSNGTACSFKRLSRVANLAISRLGHSDLSRKGRLNRFDLHDDTARAVEVLTAEIPVPKNDPRAVGNRDRRSSSGCKVQEADT